VIVGVDKERIVKESLKILNGDGKIGKIPKFWDGKAAERIVKIGSFLFFVKLKEPDYSD